MEDPTVHNNRGSVFDVPTAGYLQSGIGGNRYRRSIREQPSVKARTGLVQPERAIVDCGGSRKRAGSGQRQDSRSGFGQPSSSANGS